MNRIFAGSFFTSFFALALSAATTLEVGPDKTYTDIASAIAAAEDGDTVLVADGVYEITAQIEVTKPLTLKSVNGADATEIRRVGTSTAKTGTHIERVLSIDCAQAVVEGFSLTGGRVVKNDAAPAYEGAGAGVRIGADGGLLSHCIVSNNTQILGICYAAGVAVLGSDGKIADCIITCNSDAHGGDVKGYGFGVFMLGGEMTDSEISFNAESCNYARGSVLLNGAATMRRCKVIGNTAPNAKNYDWGADWQATAGVYVMTGGALIENCLIAGNVSKLGTATCGTGGGLALDAVAADIVNCTIVGNTAGVGGGVWTKSTKAKFVNCIIQDNAGDANPQFFGAEKVTARNCICETAFTATGSASNKTGRVAFKEGGYEPLANQISYDSGTIEGYDWLATTVDLNKKPRIASDAIDIGCYEFSIEGYEVNIAAVPTAAKVLKGTTVQYAASIFPEPATALCRWTVDGTVVSSDMAFPYTFTDCGTHEVMLSVTIDGVAQEDKSTTVTVYPRQLYVVSAEDNPDHSPCAPYDTEETAAFSIEDALAYAIDGAVIAVGPGTYENANEIAIEDDIALIAVAGPERTVMRRQGNQTSANVRRRILSVNCASATVSGFAIENGYASDWSEASWGTGVRLGASGGTVTNCVIRNCRLTAVQNAYGAAAYVAGGCLTGCVITNNVLSVGDQTYMHGGGAGVCLAGGRLENCKVMANQLALSSVSGRKQIGGGVLLRNGKMTGCLVASNVSDTPGAGLAIEATMAGGVAVVSNCTFVANVSAASLGGVLVNLIGAGSEFVNCSFAGNVAEQAPADISIVTANMTAKYCFGPEGELPEGEGNVFGFDPRFIDAEMGDFRPAQNSPLIDAGVNGDWMTDSFDLAGSPRLSHRRVDIGCYEYDNVGMVFFLR